MRSTTLARLQATDTPFEIRIQRRYNPEGLSRYNIVPGLLGVILTMTMIMMSALAIGEVLPLTHFLRIVRGILLKGNGLTEIAPSLWPIGAFMLGAGIIALMRYRRTLD